MEERAQSVAEALGPFATVNDAGHAESGICPQGRSEVLTFGDNPDDTRADRVATYAIDSKLAAD